MGRPSSQPQSAQDPLVSAQLSAFAGLAGGLSTFCDDVAESLNLAAVSITYMDETEVTTTVGCRGYDLATSSTKKAITGFATALNDRSVLRRRRRVTSRLGSKLHGPGVRAEMIGTPLPDIRGIRQGALVVVSTDAAGSNVKIESTLKLIAKLLGQTLQEPPSAHGERAEHGDPDELASAEERLTALASTLPGAMFQYVRSPDGEEKISFMSSGCKAIWGVEPEELERNAEFAWATVVPEDRAALKASIQRSQDELSEWHHRWRIRAHSGEYRWLQAHASPYQMSGGRVGWNTLVLDVTVEQEAQIALAENTRLLHEAQKLDSIGRLAGGVAHDFNNILAVIVGNAETIDRTTVEQDTCKSLDEIIEAAQKGASLVKQLLSFARRSDLRANVMDVHRVLNDMDGLIRRVLPANISLEIAQRAGLWQVDLDRTMLESAILNVVINARDAMEDGGSITIETSNVRVDNDYITSRDEDIMPGRYVMLAITDTGKGITDADMPYVFDPFFTTKGPSGGSGLGLAMLQGFVKQSSGMVRIYSEVGHGTSVKMFFPAVGQGDDDETPNRRPITKYGQHTVSVLLVEDENQVRKIIEKTITSAGFRVISCASGDAAFEFFSTNSDSIDLIVTDVVMPGKIQGPQLVRLARKIKNDIPVLYMSGYPHEANVHGNGIRVTDISLMKPIRKSDLLAALAKLKSHI